MLTDETDPILYPSLIGADSNDLILNRPRKRPYDFVTTSRTKKIASQNDTSDKEEELEIDEDEPDNDQMSKEPLNQSLEVESAEALLKLASIFEMNALHEDKLCQHHQICSNDGTTKSSEKVFRRTSNPGKVSIIDLINQQPEDDDVPQKNVDANDAFSSKKDWKRCATHVAIAYYIFYQKQQSKIKGLTSSQAGQILDPTWYSRVLRENEAKKRQNMVLEKPLYNQTQQLHHLRQQQPPPSHNLQQIHRDLLSSSILKVQGNPAHLNKIANTSETTNVSPPFLSTYPNNALKHRQPPTLQHMSSPSHYPLSYSHPFGTSQSHPYPHTNPLHNSHLIGHPVRPIGVVDKGANGSFRRGRGHSIGSGPPSPHVQAQLAQQLRLRLASFNQQS
eukprot:TRINITY_DN1655_c0_g1_i1.p1 TRINITY_DN1655_c0_g1~~TRINITY_DN1655_c0_g1_i1.p1  ORF type:complete len:391 (-),score=58.67 TRINITY_DN1655_c0_g1_i1:36-1208(-)